MKESRLAGDQGRRLGSKYQAHLRSAGQARYLTAGKRKFLELFEGLK